MESGINLLPEITEKEINSGVYRRKANIVAIGFLVIIGAIVLILISYQVYLRVNASSIEAKSKEAEQRVIENREIEVTNAALKEKLDKIEKFLVSEIPTSTLIDEVSRASRTSSPVSVDGLDADSDGSVIVDGTVISSDVFREWIENLTNTNGQDFFARINLINLTGSPGSYKFSFRMNFLKKGVYQPK